MARRLVGSPQSDGDSAAINADLCGGDAGVLLSDVGSCALSERGVWNYGENDWVRVSLRWNLLRSHALSADRTNRGPHR